MLIMSEQAFKKRNSGHKFCNLSTACSVEICNFAFGQEGVF